ncbi:polysaccharide biosynthesis/export family protein [Methylomonas sp. MED-D]|uniref:polysaccharide biosynthesis/export family protein n=2 Tax=unclassified Methylomonas TaxID=2608980 RepID=UPI003D024F8A
MTFENRYGRVRRHFPVLAYLLTLGLVACGSPAKVGLPDEEAMAERDLRRIDLSELPVPVTRIVSGDTLRVLRQSPTPISKSEPTMFLVRPDGKFAYPNVGLVQAVGRTPEQVANEITEKLSGIYRYPLVAVNIANGSGNRVFVGGAVAKPTNIDVSAPTSLEQAILDAGGLQAAADGEHVALLRIGEDNLYQVYFIDYARLLDDPSRQRRLLLQRGDVVFAPKSDLGNAIEVVDLYFRQLIPFSKSVGLGLSYFSYGYIQ